ncbi:MAG TPA: hypothetical protein VJ112_03400 [Rhabdochlamydiaceae bacterium]|nr:hypothetical protein [Rhabdochlamydiaceae bacterium]
MSKIRFWYSSAIFVVSGAVALWFNGNALIDLWRYFRLGPVVEAEVTGWMVEEISSSKFGLEATYNYQVGGKQYCAKTLFKQPVYLNPYSAEKDLQKWKEKSWRAWYNSKSPAYSSLQKLFPLNSCIQAALSLAVFFYFAFVNVFFNRRERAQ